MVEQKAQHGGYVLADIDADVFAQQLPGGDSEHGRHQGQHGASQDKTPREERTTSPRAVPGGLCFDLRWARLWKITEGVYALQ